MYKNSIRKGFALVLIVGFALLSHAQNLAPWTAIDSTEGLSIWYRKIENTPIKELKINFDSKADAHDWVSAIRNVETMPEWSHTCRSTSLLKRDEDNTLYFYYIADIPWPIRGRDVVLQMHSFIDSVSGNPIITSNNYDGLVDEKEDYIRVRYMKARWEFKVKANGLTSIEYFISTEISNSFPDWLVEKAITYSPVKSIAALRKIIE